MDPGLADILASDWPRAPPKVPGGEEQVATQRPAGELFRYLGVYFGNDDVVAAHYKKKLEGFHKELRTFSLFGLEAHTKAWLINTFFFSKFVFHIPYVAQYNAPAMALMTQKACDKINGRLCSPTGTEPRRTFNNTFITQSLEAGGLGLRNLTHHAQSLRMCRAARFFDEDSPARRDVLHHFACATLPNDNTQLDHHPALRLLKTNWFALDNWYWKKLLSPTLEAGLYDLHGRFPVKTDLPPLEKRLRCLNFYNQRCVFPNAPITEEQMSYLLDHIPATPSEAMEAWRSYDTPQKNDTWKLLLPKEEDVDYSNWKRANRHLNKHYRIDSRAAETLHFLRATRLKVIRRYYPDSVFKYKQAGCGACRSYTESAKIHQHIFNECPVIRRICDTIGVPLPARMADWVLLESKHGIQHHLRDLANAIWRFERAMRMKGLRGSDPLVQLAHLHLFDRAITGYAMDMKRRAAVAARLEENENED